MTEAEVRAIPRSPSSSDGANSGTHWKPHEVDPDLAAAKMAADMIQKMGNPSVITTPFVVFNGIVKGINHRPKTATDPGNLTGLDLSMLIAILDGVKSESINVNGMYFEHFWTYMNKPKMIVQGLPNQPAMQEEVKESLWDKTFGRLLGTSKKPTEVNNGN